MNRTGIEPNEAGRNEAGRNEIGLDCLPSVTDTGNW